MPVTLKECPHCYMRVAFKEDGLCPACAKNLSDPGADPSKTLLNISEGPALPSICLQCGADTERIVTIAKDTRPPGAGILQLIWITFVLCLTLIVHSFIHLLHRGGNKRYPHKRVRLKIPFCRDCQQKQGLPKPQRVDFETGTMSFLVNRAVAARWSAMSGKKKSPVL